MTDSHPTGSSDVDLRGGYPSLDVADSELSSVTLRSKDGSLAIVLLHSSTASGRYN